MTAFYAITTQASERPTNTRLASKLSADIIFGQSELFFASKASKIVSFLAFELN